MCGIVGILWRGPVAGAIVDALRRLEYRGYDSAGVATLEDGRLTRVRASGKLKNLEEKLAAAPLYGAIGIGHTRWATHGKPNETNAHPHASSKVAVVHNGIIENFRELRAELTAEGHVSPIASETDSEVVAHLVADEMRRGATPEKAVAAALKRLKGAFALAFLFEGENDLLIGARRGSPLAVGWSDDGVYVGSDALALAPFATSKPGLSRVGLRMDFGRAPAGRAADRLIGPPFPPLAERCVFLSDDPIRPVAKNGNDI